MRGRSREEKKSPADEKEQTGPEAQDSQQPSRILPGFLPDSAGTGRVHRRDPETPPKTRKTGPWDEEPSLLGRRGEAPSPKRKLLKGHYNADEPVKKRREKPLGRKDRQGFTQPPDPEGSQNSGDSDYKDEQQEKEGKDEQEREAGRSPVRERAELGN